MFFIKKNYYNFCHNKLKALDSLKKVAKKIAQKCELHSLLNSYFKIFLYDLIFFNILLTAYYIELLLLLFYFSYVVTPFYILT